MRNLASYLFNIPNLVGIGENRKVYYITIDDNIICYISADINIFIKELLLYDNYMMHRPNNLDESQLIEFTEKFRKELLDLDKTAFLDENTYWSEICEEMEYGF
ncbi:MAG: hypothetical protein VZR09_11795 [Candidatus Gastranaerophilaceae bacterium]|nr:hypothetical protein [Candidatus Gastranaerophilaceae bacterium]